MKISKNIKLSKPHINTIIFYLLALILGGCFTVSLQPLYTEDDIIFEEKLLGKWCQQDDPNEPCLIWKFEKANINDPNSITEPSPKTYQLTVMSEDPNDTAKGSFDAVLLKLDNKLFLDLHPNKLPCQTTDTDSCQWEFNIPFFVPVHSFAKVFITGDILELRFLSSYDLKKFLKENPKAINHHIVDDEIVLTEQTLALQQFVIKHADNNDLFSLDFELPRK